VLCEDLLYVLLAFSRFQSRTLTLHQISVAVKADGAYLESGLG